MHPFRFLEDFLTSFVRPSLLFILLILSHKFESLEANKIQHYLIEFYYSVNFVQLDHYDTLELLASSNVWAFENQANLRTYSWTSFFPLIFLVSHLVIIRKELLLTPISILI